MLDRTILILWNTSRPTNDVKKRVTANVSFHAEIYGNRRNVGNTLAKENVKRQQQQPSAVLLAKITEFQ